MRYMRVYGVYASLCVYMCVYACIYVHMRVYAYTCAYMRGSARICVTSVLKCKWGRNQPYLHTNGRFIFACVYLCSSARGWSLDHPSCFGTIHESAKLTAYSAKTQRTGQLALQRIPKLALSVPRSLRSNTPEARCPANLLNDRLHKMY